MKKVLGLIMVMVMVVSLCACSGKEASDTSSDTAVTEQPAATEVPSSEAETQDVAASDTAVSEDAATEKTDEFTGTVANEKYSIAVIVKNLTNPMWVAVEDGAKKAAEEAGIDLTILAPSVADNNEEQISLIEQCIAKGVDAMVVIPADSVGIVPAIEEANEAGIPVINVNTKIDTSSGCKIETFIAVENYTAAVSVADKLVEMMKETGNVIILEGKAGAQSSTDIVAGANDTFAKYENIKVVASQTANWSRTDAYTVTLNLLEANPDATAIFAANDEMAMGALEAVSQAGKEGSILITGLDANSDAKAAVDTGTLAITCDKNGNGQGYDGIMAAIKLLNGETLVSSYIVDTFLYTK